MQTCSEIGTFMRKSVCAASKMIVKPLHLAAFRQRHAPAFGEGFSQELEGVPKIIMKKRLIKR
jgi:hypothetical protein